MRCRANASVAMSRGMNLEILAVTHPGVAPRKEGYISS